MATFKVAAAPFPYVERPVTQRRPCLIVGRPDGSHDLVWVLMITSAENATIPGDVIIDDLPSAGLRHPSVIRTAKVATVSRNHLHIIGEVSGEAANVTRKFVVTWLDNAAT